MYIQPGYIELATNIIERQVDLIAVGYHRKISKYKSKSYELSLMFTDGTTKRHPIFQNDYAIGRKIKWGGYREVVLVKISSEEVNEGMRSFVYILDQKYLCLPDATVILKSNVVQMRSYKTDDHSDGLEVLGKNNKKLFSHEFKTKEYQHFKDILLLQLEGKI
jgi:hypothetical protein